MRTFDINSGEADLGAVRVTPSNTEKHWADFCGFLDRGVILNSATVTLADGAVSTLTATGLGMNHQKVWWLLAAASEEENFDLTLRAVTNDGQTLLYTVHYQIG